MKRNLNEGSRAGDLKYLVTPNVHFDEYNSKMGRDDVVITASFKIKSREPALDLVSFLESGYDWVLDADISSGEVEDGSYIVFLEMQRKESNTKNFMSLLDDLYYLTGIKPTDWKFRWYKDTNYSPLTSENLQEMVPTTPARYKEYIESFEQIKEQTDLLKGEISDLKRLSGIT